MAIEVIHFGVIVETTKVFELFKGTWEKKSKGILLVLQKHKSFK